MSNEDNQLARVNTDLNDWGSWCLSHLDKSNIGFPSQTAEGRAMSSGPSIQQTNWMPSRCPEVMMPKHIHKIDQAVKELRHVNYPVMIAIYCKYYPEGAESLGNIEDRHAGKWTPGDQMRLFCRITGQCVNDYYNCWRFGQYYAVGRGR